MTESAEQIVERIVSRHNGRTFNSASEAKKALRDAIVVAMIAAHQARDEAIKRAEQAEADAAALREALKDAREVLDLGGARYVYGCVDKAGALVARLDAVLSAPATSLAALEKRVMLECAVWHDREAENAICAMHSGMSNSERLACHRLSDFHTDSAAAIRKLAEEK